MLERNASKTEHFGFLISAELDLDRVKVAYVQEKLADALSWVEGVGEVEVECLGKIDVYEPSEVEHSFYEELNKK